MPHHKFVLPFFYALLGATTVGCGSQPAPSPTASSPTTTNQNSRTTTKRPPQPARPEPHAAPWIKGLDLTRIRTPKGFGKFCADNNNSAAYSSRKNPDRILQRAREYESLDHFLGGWAWDLPQIKTDCAGAIAKAGRPEEGLKVLQEIAERGYMPKADRIADVKWFESVKGTAEFQQIVDAADELTDDQSSALVSLVKQPYCQLADLLSIKTKPSLPPAANFTGKAVVVLTGISISEGGKNPNQWLAKEMADSDVRTIAILSRPPEQEFPNIDVYLAEGDPKRLLIDGANFVWFANKQGEVVHINRSDTYDNPAQSRFVAEYLDSVE